MEFAAEFGGDRRETIAEPPLSLLNGGCPDWNLKLEDVVDDVVDSAKIIISAPSQPSPAPLLLQPTTQPPLSPTVTAAAATVPQSQPPATKLAVVTTAGALRGGGLRILPIATYRLPTASILNSSVKKDATSATTWPGNLTLFYSKQPTTVASPRGGKPISNVAHDFGAC